MYQILSRSDFVDCDLISKRFCFFSVHSVCSSRSFCVILQRHDVIYMYMYTSKLVQMIAIRYGVYFAAVVLSFFPFLLHRH